MMCREMVPLCLALFVASSRRQGGTARRHRPVPVGLPRAYLRGTRFHSCRSSSHQRREWNRIPRSERSFPLSSARCSAFHRSHPPPPRTAHPPSGVRPPPSGVRPLPPGIRHPPSAIRHLPSGLRDPPSGICHPPSGTCHLPSGICHPPFLLPHSPF